MPDLLRAELPASDPDASIESAYPINATRPQDVALALIGTGLLVFGLVVLAIRWRAPLLGMHSFRQTQAAITVYWLLRGAPWLAYPTPVLGAPWSVPFEFPIYQLLVAGLVKLTGLPLDPAGRLLSYLFLCLTILPVRALARAYGMGRKEVRVFAILLLGSPIYLYWGTAFLMETLAVFLAFGFLAEVERVARTTRWIDVLASTICGVFGVLCNVTTFIPFYLFASLILLCHLGKRLQRREPVRRFIILSAAMMIPPPPVFWFWNRFADVQKSRNPIGTFMVSTNSMMHGWVFGTWNQLFSERMLVTLLRSVTDTLGVLSLPILGLLIFLAFRHRIFDRVSSIVLTASLIGFLLPFVVFTNLHILHNYYDVANAIFLIGGVAVVIGRLFSTRHYRTAWCCLALVIASQLLWFHLQFMQDILHPQDRWLLAVAETVKSNTDPGGVVVIYGEEWSPVIPYYAERRALMEPTFVPAAEVDARLHHILLPQGGHPVDAIVRCPSIMDKDPEFVRNFAAFDTEFPKQRVGSCDIYFTGRGRVRKRPPSIP